MAARTDTRRAGKVEVFISHTTHDHRDRALAKHLADGLGECGVRVWIAPDSISPGDLWERELASAIAEQCTHFLVILSLAATESGWVRREIGLARQRREHNPEFVILPLLVGDLCDYPEADFIDQFQRVPYHDERSVQLEAVKATVGLRPGVPANYSGLIDGFVGRDYVFKAVDGFMDEHGHGYFTIVADPGEGKSTILAEFVRRTGCIAHFNVRAEGIDRPEQCLASICGQLCARYDLPHASPSADQVRDASLLRLLLSQAAAELGPSEQLVIGIDALDELDLSEHPPLANILYLPAELPDRVCFLMTRRREHVHLVANAPQSVLDLRDYRSESLGDIQTYIRRALDRPQLRTWLDIREMSVETFVRELANKSEWNFMYLRHVLPEIERGAYQDLSIKELPAGLRGYYEDHWGRMGMVTRPLPHTKIRIVALMAVMRRPVSRDAVAFLLKEDPVIVQDVLDQWSQFLHEEIVNGQVRYSVYHTSFLDFIDSKRIVEAEHMREFVAERLQQTREET